MKKESVGDPKIIGGGQIFPLIGMSCKEHRKRRLVLPELLRNPTGTPWVAHRGFFPENKISDSLNQALPEINILHARIRKPFVESTQCTEKLLLDGKVARPQKAADLVLGRTLSE